MSTPAPFQPLYLQIKGLLEQRLEAGEWRPAEPIPSEHDLARRFGVSQGTVRKAIEALAADNLVVRRQGKGTFVATHTEERASMFRFLRIRRNDGEDEYPGSRLIDVRRAKAPAEVARLLELKPGDGVIVLRRVLEYSGAPVVLDEITLPAALFKGLTKARFLAYQGPMYGFFETQFGVRCLQRRGKAPRRGRRSGERAPAPRCDRNAAPCGRPDHIHLWRSARGMAPWPLRHPRPPLFQPPELACPNAGEGTACRSFGPATIAL